MQKKEGRKMMMMIPERVKHCHKIHSDELVDYYQYMRNKKDQRVVDYIKSENTNFQSEAKQWGDLKTTVFEEMKNLMKEDDTSVPFPYKSHEYYYRNEKGKEYRIYCRKKVGNDQDKAKEEIWLDVNVFAKDKKYCRIGNYEISPDEKLVIFSADFEGDNIFDLYVQELESGKVIEVVKSDDVSKDEEEKKEKRLIAWTFCWDNESKSFFYSLKDKAKRTFKVMHHYLGNNVEKDRLIFKEDDEKFWVSVSKTLSERFILISSGSELTTEYFYIDLFAKEGVEGKPKIVIKRQKNIEYYLEHHENHFVIFENSRNYENFRIIQTPIENPSLDEPSLIEYSPDIYILSVDCFKDFMVIKCREKGSLKLKVYHYESKKLEDIKFDSDNYYASLGTIVEYDIDRIRISYSSLICPFTVYDYVIKEKKLIFKKCVVNKKNFSGEHYCTKLMHVLSRDKKTKIPISIVYHKEKYKMNTGEQKALLYGYGAYGLSTDVYFRKNIIPLLNRGWIYVIAHVRGGCEMGRKWYKDGKMKNKMNSFYDFIDVGEYLVENKFCSKKHLSIYGGSAGGLLVGSCLLFDKKKYFSSAIMNVPFVDLMNTMLDETIPLTVGEYDEWGNPNKEDEYKYMKQYSPYDQLDSIDYLPKVFIIGNMNDSQVQYWEPVKWTAKARHLIDFEKKIKNEKIVLKVQMESGHGGASGRYESLWEYAEINSFLIHENKI